MLTLDLPPTIEQEIINNAHAQNLSVSEYVVRHLPKQKDQASLKAAAGLMYGKLDEMLAFQQQLRNDWD